MSRAPQLRAKIVELLADASVRELEPEQIRDEQRLREDLAIGSLTELALLMDLERELDCEIADARLAELRTVGELLAFVVELDASREVDRGT